MKVVRRALSLMAGGGLMMLVCMSAQAGTFNALQPLPKQPPIPQDNPVTPAKVALGKQLYFDARLSLTGTHSCNACARSTRPSRSAIRVMTTSCLAP